MMKNKFLIVPLNKKGLEEYNYCLENTENIIEKDLPSSEYNVLVNQGVFDRFNERFVLNISNYECEEIYFEDLDEAFDLVLPFVDDLPIFVSCLKLAIEKRTLLGINL